MASWHGRPGHDAKLDRFVNFVYQVDLELSIGHWNAVSPIGMTCAGVGVLARWQESAD